MFILACGAMLPSCGDDEELQRQIIELRGKVEERNRTVEQLQAQVANLQSKAKVAVVTPEIAGAPGAAAAANQELAKARTRIAELEQQIASTPAAPATIGRLDMDAIATKLEEDLAAKAKQLRQLVQRQSPSSRIDEITLKTIEYPPQLVTPFTSAITFTVTVGNAAPMRLMFPVTADLGGSWRLPTPDEIQKAYQAAKDQPPAPVAAGGSDAASGKAPDAVTPRSKAPASPAPAAASTGGGGSVTGTTTTASGARMTQRADGVFVFDWGDAPPAAAAQGSGAGRSAVGQRTAPAPAAPAPPPAASPAAPRGGSAPPPVMPIVGDRVIRFED